MQPQEQDEVELKVKNSKETNEILIILISTSSHHNCVITSMLGVTCSVSHILHTGQSLSKIIHRTVKHCHCNTHHVHTCVWVCLCGRLDLYIERSRGWIQRNNIGKLVYSWQVSHRSDLRHPFKNMRS